MNKNSIYGAIIGDIAGSHLEVKEIMHLKNKTQMPYEDRVKILSQPSIFTDACSLTDDSILTIAIADSILSKTNYEQKLKEYGLKEIELGMDKYGRSRFGASFVDWVKGSYQGNSFGNGCAMRISAIGYAFPSLKKTLDESKRATLPSHNHPDSIKCAQAVAGAIYLARTGNSKQQIKGFVETMLEMDLDYDLDQLRHNYKFTSKAIDSVPQAIYCFLVSNSFEDTLRNSLSIGGDVDTIAAIACSIASAYYEIPKNLLNNAKQFIPPCYDDILKQFSEKYMEVHDENIR